ncbi:response regulator transcription factor [Rathayibacter soli]|uniref:response regulator transcription factor n=1 Tax=Rathayibacter soli TaxID=3144168 RepID=UPI0027E3BCEF|nr:response regulator transcription factor [Glaciibacter superstes]
MQSGARIMVVEDDATVRTVIADHLRAAGCDVVQHADGESALAAVHERMPDLLILDRMLPHIDGDEVCRQVRAVSAVPIIMLTALDSVESRIEGLEGGADDYLTKPFSLRELQLRVNAQLRRTAAGAAAGAPLEFAVGQFRIDPAHRRVWVAGREIDLTTREYQLFLYLARNPQRVISREEIMREVWQWGFGDASTVTVHVRRLREKIEPDPRFPCFLMTEWGAGYRLSVDGGTSC